MKARFLSTVVSAVLAMVATPMALADVIITPADVIRNDFGEFSDQYPIVNMINQTNNTPTFVSGVDDFDAYAALNPTATSNNESTQFFGVAGNNGPIIDFDLGGVYVINQLGLFNNQHRGFSDVDIYTANQADFSDAVFVGNYTFALSGDPDAQSPFEVRALGGTTGRYVRLDVNSFGTDILGGKQISFGVVPAPSTFAVLAAAGFASSRRRR